VNEVLPFAGDERGALEEVWDGEGEEAADGEFGRKGTDKVEDASSVLFEKFYLAGYVTGETCCYGRLDQDE